MNKIICENGYVIGIADTPYGNDNADEVAEILKHQPTAEDGYQYRLLADTLEWERCELLPVPEDDEEITLEDALAKLRELGVEI